MMNAKSFLTCLIGTITLILPSTSSAAPQTSERQLPAVNYRARSWPTNIDFKGTNLMPAAKGKAKVESKPGYVSIEAEFDKLGPATTFGNEYLAYVLWTVTPEGRSASLGELILDGSKSKLKVTTRLQTFAMLVTAEPYFAVSQPSNLVVLENVPRETTIGSVVIVSPKSRLVGGGYAPSGYKFDPIGVSSGQASELIQIQNARRIAKLAEADKYASDSFQAAEVTYRQVAEYAVQKKTPTKELITSARQAIQAYEDSRVIAVKKKAEEQQEAERQAAAAKEAAARAAAEDEARRRAQAEQEAQAAAQRALQARRAAEEAERQKQLADQQRLQAEQEKQALRAKILAQLNTILETQDTDRGLVATMADVLFDTGRYELRPVAREKLAKFSGVMLAYPGLNLMVEGHTDTIGSADFNQKLSEQRANEARQYLVEQGIGAARISAQGLGQNQPRVPNDSAANRQLNRRVELVISGEVIGTKVGGEGSQ